MHPLRIGSISSTTELNPWRVLFPFNVLLVGLTTGCDRTFVSTSEGAKNGTFSSPVLMNPPVNNHSYIIQCLFTFVAAPGERVHLSFDRFSLRGALPECLHEYIDVYSEVPDGKDLSDLIHTPFGGRYCGHIPPRARISLYNTLVLGYTTDLNHTTDRIFSGTYSFIKDDKYLVGTTVKSPCSYVINGTVKRTGEIYTPTYPGVYPKNLYCSFQLVGKKGQRILMEFRDFDIFYGGSHCPFDSVSVFDGPSKDFPLIGTYCGQQRNLVIYSTDHYLFLTFTSLPRTADAQNRGFSGIYEFSESFVKLDFISRNDGQHIRGTECDQKILSRKESSGIIYSPNYPFPYVPRTVCRYFIYGLQDMQHYERVKLEFEKFDVPNIIQDENCSEEGGFVRLFLKGQEATQAYDKGDYEFCGKELPETTSSDGPRLVVIFASGPSQGSGFKAKYSFSTEYQIPGTPAPDGSCRFTYLSSSVKQGEFNSPRHPANYPSNTTCVYTMIAEYGEQVRLVFDNFKLRTTLQSEGLKYGDLCKEDWVEIHNIFRNGSSRLFGRYCNETSPGPMESSLGASGLKVVFRTDAWGVSSGFKARYFFEREKPLFEECGQHLVASRLGANSGVIASAKYPAHYDGGKKVIGAKTCYWLLTARPGYRILLFFTNFGIEGTPTERGCPVATVRVWSKVGAGLSPIELCGENLTPEQMQHLSQGNQMRVAFSIADKAVGAPGFRAVWTEVESIEEGYCSQFQCVVSRICLHKENLCDGLYNCGFNDTSDETYGCSGTRPFVIFLVQIIAIILLR
ncbi:cubilin-like [Artemia franciscana]|uniref:CUB domain-containing protein n=1 Tax=Artemia franciscana TaxID=6661 RepID=A0AA88HVJ6_ARTSF|nr:hypothetical protein QYM36_010492 [Artemia franciscana]KAK2715938.1 hypothetical protein QYM36_010492 [Artemia franciscana]